MDVNATGEDSPFTVAIARQQARSIHSSKHRGLTISDTVVDMTTGPDAAAFRFPGWSLLGSSRREPTCKISCG
jgi:hypothetical protein